jgi:hypothetical protein
MVGLFCKPTVRVLTRKVPLVENVGRSICAGGTPMNSEKRHWIAPNVKELSVRETEATNGSDTDAQGGGIWLFEAPAKPPTGTWGTVSAADKARVAEFLHGISSSPEKLHSAMTKPRDTMKSAGLTQDQIKIVKGVMAYFGR